ncbi:hypothetical protein [Haloferula sp. BvORR071]|uniref:hypothetical protein n=1 Tax=Haloferula sp. BvORR071 TaxID=1396141 RepID=UPI000552A11B|nr:hypothetical protein [Haloferula sp. BvORR071]
MLRKLWKPLGLTSCLFALASCGNGGSDAWQKATSARSETLNESADLLGVTVPVLRAKGLEQVWGSPKIKRDGQGGYLLTYADPKQPFTRLMIHGMAAPLPRLSQPPLLSGEHMVRDTLTGYQKKQEWREVTILDEKVRWFQESASGGADGAYFSTEGFTLKASDGRKGHYRLVAEHGDDEAVEVARWFSSVSF